MDFFKAKAACSVNDKCSMFYDYRGRKYYYLCGEPTRIYTSSKGSIRYTIENGKYIMILLYVIYTEIYIKYIILQNDYLTSQLLYV